MGRSGEIRIMTLAALAVPTPQERANQALERRIREAAAEIERIQVQAAIRATRKINRKGRAVCGENAAI